MVNEDGIIELRKRSSRMAAVRRYSRHAELHRRRAEGGGAALPALPLAAIQDGLFSEALHGRSACERLVGLKVGAMRNCAACYEKYKKRDARRTKSPWRRALLFVLDEPRSSALAFVLYVVLVLNIVVSVLVLYLQSLAHLSDSVALHSIELGCTIVFTCEVIVRVAAADHPATLLFDLMVWVDIASVVPFYIELGVAADTGMPVEAALFGDEIRSSTDLHAHGRGGEAGGEVTNMLQLLRLLRLLRLLKLGRHYEGSIVLGSALKRSATALLVPCFFLCVMICLFAGLMFYLEGPTGGGQAGFDNMFKASWFVLVTLTTVGYGDLFPITIGGQLVASAAIMCGVLFMAMPITIVGNSFAQVWEKRRRLQHSTNFLLSYLLELTRTLGTGVGGTRGAAGRDPRAAATHGARARNARGRARLQGV